MRIAKLTVIARLGGAFGLVLLVMAIMTVTGFIVLNRIGELNSQVIDKDWLQAKAANAINASTSAHAMRSFELLAATGEAEMTRIHQHIEADRKIIDDALDTLGKTTYLPEGKALLERITEARVNYVASLTRVGKLVDAGNKDEATALMRTETLPALYALQEHIAAFVEQQNRIVVASGAQVRENIDAMRMGMLILGTLALAVDIAAAAVITRARLKQPGGEPEDAAHIARKITARIRTRSGQHRRRPLAMAAMRDAIAKVAARVRRLSHRLPARIAASEQARQAPPQRPPLRVVVSNTPAAGQRA